MKTFFMVQQRSRQRKCKKPSFYKWLNHAIYQGANLRGHALMALTRGWLRKVSSVSLQVLFYNINEKQSEKIFIETSKTKINQTSSHQFINSDNYLSTNIFEKSNDKYYVIIFMYSYSLVLD